MTRLIIVSLFLLPAVWSQAQFSGGFIAGLNFSKIDGPSEVDDNGQELEGNAYKTGFHVGGRFNYGFSEQFGLRGEIMYIQKGSEFTYDGQSYWVFQDEQENLLYSTGIRTTNLKIINNYLEIPLMAYFRAGRFEISGGGYFSFLFRSTGQGDLRYSGVSEAGSTIDPFTITLAYNYVSDNFRPGGIEDTQSVVVDDQVVQVPTVIGAQYDLVTEPEDRLFNRTDLGLIGNVAVYLNQGLFLGFRFNYGLTDLTRTDRDLSRKMLTENKEPVFRDDFDRNVTMQASIGFNF